MRNDHPSPTEIASTSYTGIHPWLKSGERLNADLYLEGKTVAKISYEARHDGMTRQPAIRFTVPPRLRRLRLSGEWIPTEGKPRTFDITWNVRDIADYTAALYDTQLAFSDRIKKFVDRLVWEVEQSKDNLSSPITMRVADKDPTEALNALEARLKITLPQALRALSHYEITILNSYFSKPSELKTVLQTLPEWGYPKHGSGSLDEVLSPDTRARYERSVLVFVEVGDGMGGLAWDPRGVAQGELSNIWVDKHSSGAKCKEPNMGVWFWFHEDHIDEPNLLLDSNLQPRADEDALLNAIQRFAVDQVVDNFDLGETKEPFLIIDSAHPHGFLQLHFEADAKRPKLMLRSYDYESYSML